jgi:gentisate 1,2-dioxygenase
MATALRPTLAPPALPPDVLAEMERLNEEAAPKHIWLRTQANATMRRPWHEGVSDNLSNRPGRAQAHLWRWRDIEPYLHKIAAIAPLEFTDRQQFLLTNPGLSGQLKVAPTIRIAISIYKPGDVATTHLHTPNASRTILSKDGGYTTVEGERCEAKRGDLILTPAGTWHGHGNDSKDPVIWIDTLDWPLLEYLDAIWIHEDHGEAPKTLTPDRSRRRYAMGGVRPRFAKETRANGGRVDPLFHYRGADVRRMLEDLGGEDGSPYEGVIVEFADPETGAPAFGTLSYRAQLLRPSETTRPMRQTANTFYTVIAGSGWTEVDGRRFEWSENDTLVVPGYQWRRHGNADAHTPAILYSTTDEPLMRAIRQYRAQGRNESGAIVELTD